MLRTLVIGASTHPDRYSNQAVRLLRAYGHEVLAYGKQSGNIEDVAITSEWDASWKVDTITLYVNPMRQKDLEGPIIQLRPRRVIFNPGTENPEFSARLKELGIIAEEACTLVLLRIGKYEE